MAKQDFIAMLLAGGQGSRLGVLTDSLAKPAIPFGSRYRLIDFPLSNCTNSGLQTVGVLTQYQPLELNDYIGNGHSWDLDRNRGGLSILPPYQSSSGRNWYDGTASSIYRNFDFIDRYDPRYVIILSGDHVYKMDYAKMLAVHVEKAADATIAVITVPWEEASRFGIMHTDADLNILAFEEKPNQPKSNLASMGIYIFSWPCLRRYLLLDAEQADSDHDFGKNIIPAMLADQCKLVAYPFTGYWKDVGTIFSLWEANMDLIDHPENLSLNDENWRIYSRNPIQPPHYVGPDAIVEECYLTDGDEIYGACYHSVIGDSVTVEEGAMVKDSFLMSGSYIRSGAVLDRCIVGLGTTVGENVVVGPTAQNPNEAYLDPLCQGGITVFPNHVHITAGAHIAGNSMIRKTLAAGTSVVSPGDDRKTLGGPYAD